MSFDDASRVIGQLEGQFQAVEKKLDELARVLHDIDDRLKKIEQREVERKTERKWMLVIAGAIGGVMAKLGAALLEWVR